MPDSLKVRIEKSLAKLGVSYQDVSDPEDAAVQAAYLAETADERGDTITLLVTLSRENQEVWVQGGVDLVGMADRPDEWLSEAVVDINAGLQRTSAALFSRFKLPRFRARGFRADLSWSVARRRIVATVIVPPREFSSAVLDSSIQLVAHLGPMALTTMLVVRQKEMGNEEG